MIHSESIKELATALAKAQGAIKGAKKDSVNPHFKSAYADLESTWEACREPLSKNGLSVVQMPFSSLDGRTGIETMLLHDSGEWIKGHVDVQMSQATNPQVAGSIYSYLRRYSLQAAVGINSADDDSNAAAQKFAKTVESKPENPAPVTPPSGAVENQASTPPAGGVPVKADDTELRSQLQKRMAQAMDVGLYETGADALYAWTKYVGKDGNEHGYEDVVKMKGWQMKKAIIAGDEELNMDVPL